MILYRQDNFLTKKHCDYLIDFFKKSNSYAYNHNKIIGNINSFIFQHKDLDVLNKVSKLFNEYDLSNPDNMEIVKWPTNSNMIPHYDTGDRFAFIIYLNDNFKGGETIIDNVLITPKIGRLVLFSNGVYEHQVKKIIDGTRYTLIAWYK